MNKDTAGGWVWYATAVKSSGVDLNESLVKELFKMYIGRVPVEQAIEDIKNVSN